MKNLKEKRIIELASWLPCFDGFYNTIFDLTDSDIIDSEIEYYNINYDEFIESDNYYSLIKEYEKTIQANIIESVKDFLIDKKLITDITDISIYKPKYYNYSNDSINCTYVLNYENLKNLKKIYKENKKDIESFLDTHWLTWYEVITDVSCFGFFLEYIINKIYDENIQEAVYYDTYINTDYIASFKKGA